MTVDEALAQAADKYRSEGYEVIGPPPPETLPEALRRGYPALVAKKNGKAVLVEIWARGQIHDLPPEFLPSGWEFDVVLIPGPASLDVPGPGPSVTPEFAAGLLAELEDYVPKAAYQSRFLLAWSAAESAMRVAAAREGLDADRLPPRKLIAELVSAGLLANDQANTLEELMVVRNRLVHGTPSEPLNGQAVPALVQIARSLLNLEPLQSSV